MIYELQSRGLSVKSEVPVEVHYKGVLIENSLRLDLLVNDQIIVELKSVEDIQPIHYKQLKNILEVIQQGVRLVNKLWCVRF